MENESSEIRKIIHEVFSKEVTYLFREIFNVEEGAKFLSITPDYFRKLCSNGTIKSNKANGKIIYVYRNELINYALGKGEKTVGDAQKLANEYVLKSHLRNGNK